MSSDLTDRDIADILTAFCVEPRWQPNTVENREALRRAIEPVLAARLRSAAEPVADSVLLPLELTAENGAKAALMGEFSETREVACPDCGGDDVDFTCPLCADSGLIVESIPVSWDLLKAIHRRVVQLFGAAPPPRPDPPEVDEAMVERVAEIVGMSPGGWDMVCPIKLGNAWAAALKPAEGSGE